MLNVPAGTSICQAIVATEDLTVEIPKYSINHAKESPLLLLQALVIDTVGAVSVFKAVYVDRWELKCTSVYGNSSVPLGFVPLSVNLVMVTMALWVWAR